MRGKKEEIRKEPPSTKEPAPDQERGLTTNGRNESGAETSFIRR